MKVKKAIIPAAGWGTRLLPASKAIPKEMLPIVDKPGIQYIIEEVLASGLRDIVLVTGQGKSCIEDHFDINQELEKVLEKSGKQDILAEIKEISRMATITSVRQKIQLGTYSWGPEMQSCVQPRLLKGNLLLSFTRMI